MRIFLKRKVLVNGVQLNKDDEGYVCGVRFNSKDGDFYLCNFNENKMLPIERGDIEFAPERK